MLRRFNPSSDCGWWGRVGDAAGVAGLVTIARAMEVPSMPAPASSSARLAGAARPRPRTGAGPIGRTSRVVVAVLCVVATLVAGLAVLASPASAAERCGSTVPAGQVRVVVVVDPGTGGSPGASCLVVPEGTTGAQLLAQRAGLFGTASPRYADSGLLCAIDAYPAEGCGDRTSGGYLYWSYWSGTSGSWVYGQGNPFVRRVRDGDIEGWRFVDGSGTGSDPAPRVSPSPSLFPPLAPPPAPTPPPPAPAPDAGSSGGSSGGPSFGASGGAPAAPGGAAPGSTVEGTTDSTASPEDASSTTADTASPTTSADDEEQAVEELAVMPTSSGDGSSGAAVGVVVVVVLTAGIGTAAVVQARRRRSEGT
jgi:hypothetical protein